MERIPKKISSIVQCEDDIVFEILSWLPAKSLMRFTCISTSWNTLIRRDANFINFHIARSLTRPSTTRILLEHSHPIHNISSNHCNGLICFCDKISRIIYLHNVSTGETKPLPSSLVNCYGLTSKLFLGFDTIMKKYKLLRIFNYINDCPLKAEILTLGTNFPREIELIRGFSFSRFIDQDCIFFNGILYWRETLSYFDFREEKFGLSREEKFGIPSPYYDNYVMHHLISHNFNLEKVIGAPASLGFSKHLNELTRVSNFVENIIPL